MHHTNGLSPCESSHGWKWSEIIAKLSGNILHLIESFRDGPVYMTTVFSAETRPGKLKAVHTRHEYSDVSVPGFTSSPEQYYGECEVSEQ